MNLGDMESMLDQLRRNLTPSRQIIFTITSAGVVTIHKQYGWRVPIDSNDIGLLVDTVVVLSRGNEFLSPGLFVQVNTNADYEWIDAGRLELEGVFGIENVMSVKIQGELG